MPKLVNLDLDEIKRLWETTSLSRGEIAERVGISIDTVRRRIASNGWIRPDNLIEEEKNNRFKKILDTKIEKGIADRHSEDEFDRFKELYYNTNLSKSAIAKELGVKLSRVKHLVERLDVKRTEEHIKKVKQKANADFYKETGYNFERQEIQDKVKQTKLKQYGNANPFVTDKFKEKAIETKLNKYGNEYYNNRESAIKTCIKKYGVRNTMQCKEIIGKAVSSRMINIKETSAKISKTKLERFKNIDNKQRMLDRVAKTCIEKYGVSNYMLSDDARVQTNRISKINKMFADKIKSDEFEFTVGSYCYDIKKGKYLIEIDPTISHNTEIPYVHMVKICKDENCIKHKPINKEYHCQKTQNASDSGYHCIHIFDWDDWDKISYLIQDKQTLYARKLHIREVSTKDTAEFLNNYHIQNTCKGQTVRLGLYMGDELVELMTFGKPRYNKNYEWELLRLCTHKDYKVVGGAEKLFNCFVSSYEPNSIISYCDISKFTGDVYKRLGFEQKGRPALGKHWSRGKEHITDNLLRQRGYDQLFNANYGKGTSNEELMILNGWLPVYDCGQASYIWKCENI